MRHPWAVLIPHITPTQFLHTLPSPTSSPKWFQSDLSRQKPKRRAQRKQAEGAFFFSLGVPDLIVLSFCFSYSHPTVSGLGHRSISLPTYSIQTSYPTSPSPLATPPTVLLFPGKKDA